MKIAFATKDNITIDDHFGWCRTFAVYDVTPAGYTFLAMKNVPERGDDEVDKIDKRIEAIKDCIILYCNQIGPVAAARVIKSKIHPIKVSMPEPIAVVLARLVDVLKNPPIWLRKVLEREG